MSSTGQNKNVGPQTPSLPHRNYLILFVFYVKKSYTTNFVTSQMENVAIWFELYSVWLMIKSEKTVKCQKEQLEKAAMPKKYQLPLP